MKIVFVSGLYPTQLEAYYYNHSKNGCLQNAPNVFQWAVVRGLVENNADITVFSYPSLSFFPVGYSEIKTRPSEITFNGKTVGYSPSYCTIPFLKEQSIKHSLKEELISWVKKNKIVKDERFAVVVYHLSGPVLDAVSYVKKKYPNMIYCSIITDMILRDPRKMTQTTLLRRLQNRLLIRSINNSIPIMDGYVFLAKGMIEFVPEAKGRSIIIEGLADHITEKPELKKEETTKTLLYTGSLGIHTSIEYLVKAFHEIKSQDFRLIICGDGALRQQIIDYSDIDSRIIYKGSVLREESLKLQKSCTAVINPRRPDIPDTPYSFPSKTIEYMLSGTPMIGYKLEGIPEEYYDYFYTIPDMSMESMKEVITTVLSTPNSVLYEKALSAYNFIVNRKTAKAQIKRLLDFLSNC